MTPIVSEQILEGLNPEQKKAVMHDKGPLLIFAGAGSGKTRVITHRIAYLVRHREIKPYRILAITFTNKAAREMKNRIESLIGDEVANIWVGTFHSMLVRILRRNIALLGMDPSFTIMDSDDQKKILRQCLEEINLDEKIYPIRSIQAAISNAKNLLKSPDDFEREITQYENRKRKTAEIYRLYQKKLWEHAALDFDDILSYSVELFRKNKAVLDYYREKFEYILVDEYQDTNHAQYVLVEMLAKIHQNLCVVGDDDQSIYAFRGANIQNILDFEKDFPGCTVIKLEQNYRSTQNVLNAANCLIAHNKGRKPKTLWTQLEEGERITFIQAEDHNNEAGFIAGEIKRIVRIAKQTSFQEIAVLYRINALSRNLEGELMRQNIPYKVYGGTRFFDRREIRDLLAYMRLIIKGDNFSFERIINVPKRGIGNVTVETIRQLATKKDLPCLAICRSANEEPRLSRVWPKLVQFSEMIEGFRHRLDQNDMNLPEWMEYIQDESGLLQEIIDQQEKSSEVTDRVENLRELMSDAVEYERSLAVKREAMEFQREDVKESQKEDVFEEHPDIPDTLREKLSGYLENTALYTDMDREAESDDHVRLMTIHSAKGLEFDYVFLAGAEEQIFPGSRAIFNGGEEDIEEERRLAYVSITRARKKLVITTARSRTLFGQTQCLPVSRFVKEIPDCYIEEISAGRKERVLGDAPTNSGIRRSSKPVSAVYTASGVSTVSTGISSYLKPSQVNTGDVVFHPKFGKGKILRKIPAADDAILEIEFEDYGNRKMMTKQAKLTFKSS
jgi:DNA helicase II / ATP-dependent DNA helicase PcrA